MSSQIGADYTYNNDTTVAPVTRRKIAIIARKNPEAAATVAAILGISDGIPGVNLTGNLNQAIQNFDPYLRNLILTQFAQEIALAASGQSTQSLGSGADTGIFQPVTDSINNFFNQINLETGLALGSFNNSVGNQMKDVSNFMGQTLGNLTSMARDPLGTLQKLPESILNFIEKYVSKDLANDIEGFFKGQEVVSDVDLAEINEQISLRLKAKQDKNFQLADEIRKNMLAKGILLEDVLKNETIWKRV